MTPKQRIYALLNGKKPDRMPFHLYITWPEYGWRFSGYTIWEIILGELDGMEIFSKVVAAHTTDILTGPVGKIGNGWAKDKEIQQITKDYVFFACPKTNKRWRFDINSHVLVEIDSKNNIIDSSLHPGDSRKMEKTPSSISEANDWFKKRYENLSPIPTFPPEEDPAIAKWGKEYFMITPTLGPFVAVAYSFGFEPSLLLLAEYPKVFVHIAELFLQRFEAYFEWAAKAGYDCGHMVESWCTADLISPETYKNWVAPLHRQSAAMIKSKGLKAELYNPGWSMPILPYFKEQGWDILRFDDQCKGQEQDIAEIRRILGPDQCLYGNMNAYSLLKGDWDDITARAQYQYEKAGKTGPFIMSNGSGVCDKTDPTIINKWINYSFTLFQDES